MQQAAYITSEKHIKINAIVIDRPWMWLAAGWRDLVKAPFISMSYGLVVALFFAAITLLLLYTRWFDFAISLAAGFVFLGPILAVNLYAISRCIEKQQPISARNIFFYQRENGGQIMAFGVILMLILIGWVRLSTLWYALFFNAPISTWSSFVASLFSIDGLAFLSVFIVSGLIVAIVVFAFSAVSVPLLLDHKEMDAINALLISYEAVRANWKAMALWAVLISVLTGIGLITFYLGLVVVLPLLGYATWHAYRETLGD